MQLYKISFSQSLSIITLVMIWLVAVATFVFTRVGLFMVGIIKLRKKYAYLLCHSFQRDF